jgi:hypothetical protein
MSKAAQLRALQAQWRDLFGCEPPRCGSIILPAAVAWGQQVAEHGDISPALLRDLQAIAAQHRQPVKPQAIPDDGAGEAPAINPALSSTRLVPGARLVRVHDGVTHVVEVEEGGFRWNGTLHGSLSAVAKAITGTHWNGLLFFGLRTRRVKPRHERGGGAQVSRGATTRVGKVVRHA